MPSCIPNVGDRHRGLWIGLRLRFKRTFHGSFLLIYLCSTVSGPKPCHRCWRSDVATNAARSFVRHDGSAPADAVTTWATLDLNGSAELVF
jgi:hypothetical protein